MAVTGDSFAIACFLLLNYPGRTAVVLDKSGTDLINAFDLCGEPEAAYALLTRAQQLAIIDWATRKGVSLPAAVSSYETSLTSTITTKQAAVDTAVADLNNSIASAMDTFEQAHPA